MNHTCICKKCGLHHLKAQFKVSYDPTLCHCDKCNGQHHSLSYHQKHIKRGRYLKKVEG